MYLEKPASNNQNLIKCRKYFIMEDKCLNFYGFDDSYPISKADFKKFYREDDQIFKNILKRNDFPSQSWKIPFRKLCLGYIFSGIKKHSRIQSCIAHIQQLVQQTGKGDQLWKPRSLDEVNCFNQTYVIYNIVKSSEFSLRANIFKCLMTHYPIPLLAYDQKGLQMRFFEENYQILNKSFNMLSFELISQQKQMIEPLNGKSTLLNIFFETDFQDKTKIHSSCVGGISIQYNIYRNDEYFVNLIDVSSQVNKTTILELANASNLLIIHTREEGQQFVKSWLQENKIGLPTIIFIRDRKGAFDESNKVELVNEKEKNQANSQIKRFTLDKISQNSLKHFNTRFNEIANSVQAFVRQSYMKQDPKLLWKFSDYLAIKCNQNYLGLNQILKQLYTSEQDLSRITDKFYQWKLTSYDKDVNNQILNSQKMNKIKEQAIKQGVAPLIKKIMEFCQANASRTVETMSKLRLSLTLIINELSRDIYELYSINSQIRNYSSQLFQQKKRKIIDLLNNMQKLKYNLSAINLQEAIRQFKSIQSKYKSGKDIDQAWKKIFNTILQEFQNYIQPKAFSIEKFWSEVTYMSKFDPNYLIKTNNSEIRLNEAIVNLSKQQVKESENVEIINGDLLEMPAEFLKKIFQTHKNKKIMVMALLGPQSSGKSTLLNFVLGCDFMGSVGRCTKGVYGTYFEIDNLQLPNCEAILVLDTQGLFGNYTGKNPKRNGFDNKLVLFCLQVCDLIIMNTKGDITSQCQEILATAFDSITLQSQRLPKIYFLLNFNGSAIGMHQVKQIEKACNYITELNPGATNSFSLRHAKGMSFAYNQVARKTNATQISKYMLEKKVPSDVFYKETVELTCDIMDALHERGTSRKVPRTLGQALDEMSLMWAAINRYQILTIQGNRKMKQLREKIYLWMIKLNEQLQKELLASRVQLGSVAFKDIERWEKGQTQKYKRLIAKLQAQFQTEFLFQQGDNKTSINRFIDKALDELDALFKPVIEGLKTTIAERRYKLQMQQSQENGFQNILTLANLFKIEQSRLGKLIPDQQKRKRFELVWNEKQKEIRSKLNKGNIADETFSILQQAYKAAFKAKAKGSAQDSQMIERIKRIQSKFDSQREQFQKYLIKLKKQ